MKSRVLILVLLLLASALAQVAGDFSRVELLATTDGAGGLFVTFSPNGRTFVTGNAFGTARLWDVVSGREIRLFSGHTDYVWDAAFSPEIGRAHV